MDAGLAYLAVTAGMFFVFAALVVYTCGRKRRDRFEGAKHRMLDED